jgi:hypothetical protein
MADESGLMWEYNIPLLTNRYMLMDMAKVFLVTFLLTTGILLVATGFEYESIIPLSLIGEAIFIGLFILTSLLLGNHIGSVFILDKDGVGTKMSRRMSKLTKATIVLGVLAGNPSVTGSGLLASSQAETFHRWSIIEKATIDRQRRVITFSNNWRAVQRVYCYPDNFEQVVAFVTLMLPGKLVYR